MKIVSNQTYTTTIHEDGTYYEAVKKTVVVQDTSFESMDIDEMHHAITSALRTKISQEGIDKSISSR